jgi:hypothetical protein
MGKKRNAYRMLVGNPEGRSENFKTEFQLNIHFCSGIFFTSDVLGI